MTQLYPIYPCNQIKQEIPEPPTTKLYRLGDEITFRIPSAPDFNLNTEVIGYRPQTHLVSGVINAIDSDSFTIDLGDSQRSIPIERIPNLITHPLNGELVLMAVMRHNNK